MLHLVRHGTPTNAPPLLIVHGLYGSARNWAAVAKRLSDRREVLAMDMRNHGSSFWSDDHSYDDMAADLAEILDQPADIIGHSMGGKATMMLALTRPEKIRKLIVADMSPVVYHHTQMPMIEAMRSVDLETVNTRRDADEQLALRVENPSVRAFLLQSLDVKEKCWRLNLDALANAMPAIMDFPDVNSSFDGETLFLSGESSDYVKREHRPKIKSLFPNARFAKIPKAGHWLHAEQPHAFEAAVRAFLES